ncbi:hypothetical protein FDK32_10895 [Citrobacter freundii]|nr:hypothetical protein [Citrobacter freundii]
MLKILKSPRSNAGAYGRCGRFVDGKYIKNTIKTDGYVFKNNTIPVFPHMMWGFFLPKICHSVIA